MDPYGPLMTITVDAAALDFYRQDAPITALDPSRHRPALEGLDPDPRALAKVVRGVLVHRDWLPAMGLVLNAGRLADQHLRPVSQVVDRILTLRQGPLGSRREPVDRMVGVCRHFAVLHVALLRWHGIPARARAGFGGYFEPGWVDHWITEYWNGVRWVRHDAQIGRQVAELLGLDFDPADQPLGKFLTGAEAWRLCRAGEADPDDFGIFHEHGLHFVLGDLLLDLAALNKVELLPWDMIGKGQHWQPDDNELAEVDRLAGIICSDDLTQVRSAYALRPVPNRIISLVDGVPTPVDLGGLADGLERDSSA